MKMDAYEINILAIIIGTVIIALAIIGNVYITNIKYIEHGYIQCVERGLNYPIWKKECSYDYTE